jgi:prophage regulatory protein
LSSSLSTYIKIRGFEIWGGMRFSQSTIDKHLWIFATRRDHTTFDDDLPGFGVHRADDGKTVYVVEYVKAGELVRKKIGKTRKISLKKARKAARKIIRDLPIADLQEPAPVKRRRVVAGELEPGPVKRRRVVTVESEPERVAVEPGRTIFKDGKSPRRLLRYHELKDTRGITFQRRHLYRLEAEGRFPRRVKMGENAIAWVESEIDQYLEKIIAER